VKLLGVAILLFVSTNLDDIFVLVGFFTNPKFQSKNVVIGQYAGIAVLLTMSIVGALLAFVIPRPYIGLLGIITILAGVKAFLQRRRRQEDLQQSGLDLSTRRHTQIASVALVTIANGGDNIGTYLPVFAIRSRGEIVACVVIFAFLTALWCFLAHWLVHHPRIGKSIRRYGAVCTPVVLVGIGVSILYEAGSFGLVVHGGH
jgi:cadmium resistance protein CadD (predicted permease)